MGVCVKMCVLTREGRGRRESGSNGSHTRREERVECVEKPR